MHEIITGVFVGDEDDSIDSGSLRANGITHIVVAASQLIHDVPFQEKFTYLLGDIKDEESVDLFDFYECCESFISEALEANGKVLVHCQMGISRSDVGGDVYLLHGR